jgi:hypothetical protein
MELESVTRGDEGLWMSEWWACDSRIGLRRFKTNAKATWISSRWL